MPNLTTFAGRPVERFDPERGLHAPQAVATCAGGAYWIEPEPLPRDPNAGVLRRMARGVRSFFQVPQQHHDRAEEVLRLLEADPRAPELEALVVGLWDDPAAVRDWFVEHARLPALRHLFLGDIDSDELELSWITQTDLAPLLAALPELHTLHLRGDDGLALGSGVRHEQLRDLQVECVALGQPFVAALWGAQLPALERLELWLGDDDQADPVITADDLGPLLSGKLFPALRHLGLRNSSHADAIADALATSPLLAQLEVLDLSLGTLGDAGAAALLASPVTSQLKQLDLRHHFIQEPQLLTSLRALPLDLREAPPEVGPWGDEERYVAVSE